MRTLSGATPARRDRRAAATQTATPNTLPVTLRTLRARLAFGLIGLIALAGVWTGANQAHRPSSWAPLEHAQAVQSIWTAPSAGEATPIAADAPIVWIKPSGQCPGGVSPCL